MIEEKNLIPAPKKMVEPEFIPDTEEQKSKVAELINNSLRKI